MEELKQNLLRVQQFLDEYEQSVPTYNQRKRRRRRPRHRRKRPYWYDTPDEQPYQDDLPTPTPPRNPVICYRCGNEGHVAIGCRVRLDHSRQAYHYQQIDAEDRTFANQLQPSVRETTEVTGSPNEVSVKINDITAAALLDTGSTVSTISESFYRQFLGDQDIQTLDKILKIECADGQDMPYLGYITADIELVGSSSSRPQPCILLVVPDSSYNRHVPLLLGTNILKEVLEDVRLRFGRRFLQDADMHTQWYMTFRCLLLREKELQKRSNRLGIIKSAEGKNIQIPPNKDVIIQGCIDHQLPYHPVCALLQPTDRAAISTDLDVAPTLVSYSYRNNDMVPVHISNVTTRTVTVSPNSILCEIPPVSVADITVGDNMDKDPLDEVSLPDNLSEDQLKEGKMILQQFRDVYLVQRNS